MTEDELASRLEAAIQFGEQAMTHIEQELERITTLAGLVDQLGDRFAKVAALVSDLEPEAQAEAFVQAKLAPLTRAIDEAAAALGPAAFTLSWEDTATTEAEEVTGDALQALRDAADEAMAAVSALADDATEKISEAMASLRASFEAMVEDATEATDNAGEAHEALMAVMEERIPDLGAVVSELVGAAFSAKLQEMAETINAVLSQVTALVESAGAEVIDKIQGVADVMEQINQIVQPLEPAFDAFEVLA